MKHISLETAKALKAAGFPQEGCAFVYCRETREDEPWELVHTSGYNWTDHPGYQDSPHKIAAPTEGEQLEAFSKDGRHGVYVKRQPNTWRAAWEHTGHMVHANEAAEALAALWIEVCGRKDEEE